MHYSSVPLYESENFSKNKSFKIFIEFKNIMDKVFYQMPPRMIWISAVLYVLLQHLSLNGWLEYNITVSKELPALLAEGLVPWCSCCWHAESWKGEIIRLNKSKSQRKWESKFRDPTSTKLISKSSAWQPVEAEVGAEGWNRCTSSPVKSSPISLDATSCDFFHLHNKMGL